MQSGKTEEHRTRRAPIDKDGSIFCFAIRIDDMHYVEVFSEDIISDEIYFDVVWELCKIIFIF